ncbi:CsbD family protein [Myroides injenensis]|uniref:CsbD family protein n=1 Tax=Myroides injenensis TaxID=1183151 RepID=UPI0002887E87|nr:CsbD family protein [Myroides injenensis]
MNKLELEGKWNRIKGAVVQKYGEWFDNDKAQAEGHLDQVLGRIQEKTGKSRDEIEKMIKDWEEKY